MQLDHQRSIPAPLAAVWAALNDNAVLQACIPGCESLVDVSDDAAKPYKQVVVIAAVGPVRAKFTGKLTLADIVESSSYTLIFEAQGGAAGFSKGTAAVQLQAIDSYSTLLHYQAKVQVGGKLAQIGSRIVDAASEKIIGDFFLRFETMLNPEAAEQKAKDFSGYLG